MKLTLMLTLLSDTTFARGDGVSGVVEEEIEYDAETGLPFVRGRTLKGLFTEECANILYALEGANALGGANAAGLPRLQAAAFRLFGEPGSGLGSAGLLRVGAALLPEADRKAVFAHVKMDDTNPKKITPTDVLETYTIIRRQTAIDGTGAPAEGSLRSARAVIRGITFSAALNYEGLDDDWDALALLVACAAALHRGGSVRNRGRGRLSAEIVELNTEDCFAYFARIAEHGE